MVITEKIKESVHIIGYGTLFDEIVADKAAYSISSELISHSVESIASLTENSSASIFSKIPQKSLVFVALDEHALNYIRLEQLYMPAKLAGHKLISLIHSNAYVSPSAKIGENVHIGSHSIISSKCTLGANVLISSQVRLENSVQIGMHCFIGAGSSVSSQTKIGRHCVIGSNVHIGKDLEIGNHCIIDQPGTIWNKPLQDGAFLEPGFQTPALIAGIGYSFRTF